MGTTTNNGLDGLQEITPPDSSVPVYLLETQLTEVSEWETPDEMIAAHKAVKEAGLAKLVALGLTEEEAKAVIGL